VYTFYSQLQHVSSGNQALSKLASKLASTRFKLQLHLPRSAHLITMLSTMAWRSRWDLISMKRWCFTAF